MNNYIKEIKALLVFFLIGALFFTFIYLISLPQVEPYFYKIFIGYVVLSVIAAVLKSTIKNKYLDQITNLVLLPFGIFYALSYFLIPVGTLFIHLMLYIMIVFLIPFTLSEFLFKFNYLPFLTKSTLLYLEITFSVFVAVLFNYQLRNIIYRISPARIHSSKKLKPFELDKLTDYLLSGKNIRFLIYSLYVIALLIINFNKFQNGSFYSNPVEDNAVLQSFITFIAFDRVIALLRELEFKPSDLLLKVQSSINNKIEHQKKDMN